jgi:hypothetical protein
MLLAAAVAVPVLNASAGTGSASPYGDPNLVSMFDGSTLDGWTASDPAGYVVRDGAIRTTGTGRGYLYYSRRQVGSFRWIFNVRQTVRDHDPAVLIWGTTAPLRDALGGTQLRVPHTKLDVAHWAQCEILGDHRTGVARMACCPIPNGASTCTGKEMVNITDPSAGRIGPLAIQVHHAGIQDEYRNLYLESPVRTSPDQLVTTAGAAAGGTKPPVTPTAEPTPAVPRIFEAEDIPRTSSVTTEVVGEGGASGGTHVKLNSAKVGNYVEFTLPRLDAGAYAVTYTYKGMDTRGLVQTTVNGVQVGYPVDQYTGTPTFGRTANVGSVTVSSGDVRIRFTVTGKTPDSRSQTASIDTITLTPTT